jgi:hypothetical protein
MNSRTPTSHFSVSSLTRGIKMDTCEEALTISMEVVYLVDCTFSATIFEGSCDLCGRFVFDSEGVYGWWR